MIKLHRKIINKIVITIIAIIMLCNFIMPNISYAETDTNNGGDFLDHILGEFLCFLPDVVNDFLQHTFVSPLDIEVEDDKYEILYSPGTIFSGQIPAFDVNFISPRNKSLYTSGERIDEIIKKEYFSYHTTLQKWRQAGATGDSKHKTDYENAKNDSKYKKTSGTYAYMGAQTIDFTAYYYFDANTRELSVCCCFDRTPDVYYSGTEVISLNGKYESSAAILQPIVSSWYKALRRIALVFLLSVLAYLGIRIVLSSTSAKDKAKYKKMLKDWIVAMCLLFTLHYVMAITITAVEKVSEITAVNGVNGEDVLVSSIRNSIANDADEFFEVIVQVIIYMVITIYTVIFTIQYFRRAIYLAFLTMIAPLIALTYPLDKIKDRTSTSIYIMASRIHI